MVQNSQTGRQGCFSPLPTPSETDAMDVGGRSDIALWLANSSPWTRVEGRWQHCSASNGRWEKQSPPLLMRARWRGFPLLSVVVVPRVRAVFTSPPSTTTTNRMPKVHCLKCLYISSSVWSVTCSVRLQTGWWRAHLVVVLSGAWRHVHLLFGM